MDILFWDIQVFFKHKKVKEGLFTMNKIEKEKIVMKDVEEYLDLKLRKSGKGENPDVICSAWVDRNGNCLQDYRAFRKYTKYYNVINS